MSDPARYSARLEPAERGEFLPVVHELAALSAAVIRPRFLRPPRPPPRGVHPPEGEQGNSAAALRFLESDTPIERKPDGSPVTAADKHAEEVMRLWIERRYPEHGILGEEFGLERGEARYRWVLDPIDGTKAFISNCYIFGTLIALLRDGRPILGAIASPLTGDVLVGLGGEETWLGERRMRVRRCARIEDATLLTTGHWEMVGHRNAFDALSRRAALYRSWGDCHGYFQVATGGADLMLDPALKPWDICALVPVIEGAGGRATGLDGGDPLQAADMLASGDHALHDEVLRLLAAVQSP